MTQPRQYLPGATYLLTRRCTQRQFLLRPSAIINQIFLYCLAIAAKNAGVLIHSICVISNHYHIVLKDPDMRIPEFMEYLNKYVAKCVNAVLGRWENLWASEPPSVVRLVDDQDVMDKMVYSLANPVAARLVSRGDHWPGVRLTGQMWEDSPILVKRPDVFFRKEGKMPDVAELKLTRPLIFEDRSASELAQDLNQAVEQREAELRQEAALEFKQHRGKGRRKGAKKKGYFLGRKKVLAQSPFARPKSRTPRRALRPQVACRNKWGRIEALQRVKEFVQAYRAAYRKWKQGIRDVVFPAGTYQLRVHAGVTCSPP